jgi:hypothetical protein
VRAATAERKSDQRESEHDADDDGEPRLARDVGADDGVVRHVVQMGEERAVEHAGREAPGSREPAANRVAAQGRNATDQEQHDRDVVDQPERPIFPAAPVARDLGHTEKKPEGNGKPGSDLVRHGSPPSFAAASIQSERAASGNNSCHGPRMRATQLVLY